MASYDTAIGKTLTVEGGFANSVWDRGGKTRYGITEAKAREHGYTGPMEELPLELAIAIYRKDYWDAILLTSLDSQKVAEEVFDTGVNCGIGTATRILQKALNALNRMGRDWPDVVEDGLMGAETISVTNLATKVREETLLKTLNVLQGARYVEICRADPTQEMNIIGWMNNRVKL